MTSRRDFIKYSALSASALTLSPSMLSAIESGEMLKRAIPSTGEELPAVGLGSSATFSRMARSDDATGLRNVLTTLLDNAGTVFDTAQGYGASEEVAGQYVRELGVQDKLFWTTKFNAAGRGGGSADVETARAQVEDSFRYFGKTPIDCMLVHNLGDLETQFPIAKELKQDGRVRYIGTTNTRPQRVGELADVMRNEELDFIGLDYAVDNRGAADELLPLAQERGIGVFVYAPFGRTRLWSRVKGVDLPEWAAEIGVNSWAQFFIKFVLAHPAVTVVTPATTKPTNMIDNLGGGVGPLPDAAMQTRMAEFVDALPSA
jgi:aryl-alcohol dehydrogenase-like predicted oxidoreductase